jgi:hypothetical protein
VSLCTTQIQQSIPHVHRHIPLLELTNLNKRKACDPVLHHSPLSTEYALRTCQKRYNYQKHYQRPELFFVLTQMLSRPHSFPLPRWKDHYKATYSRTKQMCAGNPRKDRSPLALPPLKLSCAAYVAPPGRRKSKWGIALSGGYGCERSSAPCSNPLEDRPLHTRDRMSFSFL